MSSRWLCGTPLILWSAATSIDGHVQHWALRVWPTVCGRLSVFAPLPYCGGCSRSHRRENPKNRLIVNRRRFSTLKDELLPPQQKAAAAEPALDCWCTWVGYRLPPGSTGLNIEYILLCWYCITCKGTVVPPICPPQGFPCGTPLALAVSIWEIQTGASVACRTWAVNCFSFKVAALSSIKVGGHRRM